MSSTVSPSTTARYGSTSSPSWRAAIRLTEEEIGLFREVDVPDLERGGDPDEQRATAVPGAVRPLPDDFGNPVVFRSESLDEPGLMVQTLQDLLLLARRTFWLLLIIGFALSGVAIWMAAQRWRAASFVVAGLFGVTLLVRWVVARLGASGSLTSSSSRERVRPSRTSPAGSAEPQRHPARLLGHRADRAGRSSRREQPLSVAGCDRGRHIGNRHRAWTPTRTMS